jgi:hypothetical protein
VSRSTLDGEVGDRTFFGPNLLENKNMKNPLKKLLPSVRLKADEAETRSPTVEPPMSLKEQLRRAHPTIDGSTYEVLTGKISEEEYRRRTNDL